LLFQSSWPLYTGNTILAHESNYYEGKDGLLDKGGWLILAKGLAAPVMLYTATTGITVTLGEGIIKQICEAGSKIGIDAMQQAIQKGGFDNVDWGDATIQGLPAAVWIKSVLKSAVDLTEEGGLESADSFSEFINNSAVNIVFEYVKFDSSPGAEEFIKGTGKKVIKSAVQDVVNQ
jgi:hypothetical protein